MVTASSAACDLDNMIRQRAVLSTVDQQTASASHRRGERSMPSAASQPAPNPRGHRRRPLLSSGRPHHSTMSMKTDEASDRQQYEGAGFAMHLADSALFSRSRSSLAVRTGRTKVGPPPPHAGKHVDISMPGAILSSISELISPHPLYKAVWPRRPSWQVGRRKPPYCRQPVNTAGESRVGGGNRSSGGIGSGCKEKQMKFSRCGS